MVKIMAKGKGLAVLALIFGISGLGLGLYSYILIQTPTTEITRSGIHRTWYNYDKTTYFSNPTSTNITIADLLINFSVEPNEYLYLNYVGEACAQTGFLSYVQVWFELDGVILDGPEDPDFYYITTGNRISGPVSLQHSLDNITLGIHNITISFLGSDPTNYLQKQSLLVQTYIP